MYIALALAFVALSNGFTSSGRYEYTVADVDWKELMGILKAYLCSGDNNWYNNQYNQDNRHIMNIRIILSTMTVIVCKLDISTTIPSLYWDTYRPILKQYPDMRNCYGNALKLMLSRFMCCLDQKKSIGIIMRKFWDISKNHDKGFNIISSLLSKDRFQNQLYVVLQRLKVCKSRPREAFGTIYAGHEEKPNHRVKRVYDMASWFSALNTISRMDIAHINVRNDVHKVGWDVKTTHKLVFLGEGFVFCASRHL